MLCLSGGVCVVFEWCVCVLCLSGVCVRSV